MVEENTNFIEFIYCECGCGFTTSRYHEKYGYEKKFINGHTWKGRKHKESTIIKISNSHKGKTFSEQTRKKWSINRKGENNSHWLGDDVGYHGLHIRFRKSLPKPKLCQICGLIPPRDLANKSQKYLPDINDWWWLCRKCHTTYDKIYERNLKPFNDNRTATIRLKSRPSRFHLSNSTETI